jgi:hypothetical protein
MTDTFDVLQAFVDDEPFDPAELERVLASAEGRAELIDLIALRNLARQSVPPMPARVAHDAARRGSRWLSLAAAAVISVAAGAAGYVAGERTRPAAVVSDGPAMPAEPVAAEAPAPAHVIRLEPGVDWVDRSGGR